VLLVGTTIPHEISLEEREPPRCCSSRRRQDRHPLGGAMRAVVELIRDQGHDHEITRHEQSGQYRPCHDRRAAALQTADSVAQARGKPAEEMGASQRRGRKPEPVAAAAVAQAPDGGAGRLTWRA